MSVRLSAVFRLLLLILLLCGAAWDAWARNTHGTSSPDAEQRAILGDMRRGGAVGTSCIPTTAASTTVPAFACKAYVTGSSGELVYVDQSSNAVGPLNSGNGTYWLAVHRDTVTAVAAWTRQTATHYLWRFTATQPADPSGALVIAKITVAGGVITAVQSLGAPDTVDVALSGDCTSTTLQSVVTAMGPAPRRLLLSRCLWDIATTMTIPANLTLVIGAGARVSIAASMTLTLSSCPIIEAAPGWLTVGASATVNMAAPGCPTKVHLFATGGTGTVADPWTGWDTALVWASGGTSQETHDGRHFVFVCGNYRQAAMITLPGYWSYVQGDPAGGPTCATIDYEPTGSADGDGYYTAWTFGTRPVGGVGVQNSFGGRFENLQLMSNDIAKKKRGIYIVDHRHFTVRNVWVFGVNPSCASGGSPLISGIGWCDTATFGSIGIYVQGREFIRIEDTHVTANRPLYLAGTPPGTPAGIDHNLDLTTLTNVSFWAVPVTNPTIAHNAPIYFDPLVFVTNFQIEGDCSLIGGAHFIYMDQTARAGPGVEGSANIRIDNCRGEQVESDDYRYYFVGHSTSNTSLQMMRNLQFRNLRVSEGGIGKGFFLEKVASVLFDSVNYDNYNYGYHPHTNIAVHLGPHTYPVTFLNSWIVDSAYIEVTGNQCMTFRSGKNGHTGPLGGSPLAIFDVTDTSSGGAGCTQLAFNGAPNPPAGTSNPPVLQSIAFTPHLEGETNPGVDNNVYSATQGQLGYWTRSGSLVHYYARIVLTTKGGGMAGNVNLLAVTGAASNSNNPPPVAANLTNFNQSCTVLWANISLPTFSCLTDAGANPQACRYNSGTDVTVLGIGAYIPPGQNNIVFRYQGYAVASTSFVQYTAVQNTTEIEVNCTYVTEN